MLIIIYKSLVFDQNVYKKVKKSGEYTKYCILIVLIAALADGISTTHYTNAEGLIKQLVFSIVGWVVSCSVIYLIGVKIIGYKSGIMELARTLGISYSPHVVNLFAVIPLIGINIFIISIIWAFFTAVFAVKLTFHCGKLSAFLITLAGLVPYGVIMFFLLR